MSINHRKPVSRVASTGFCLSLLAACQSLPYGDNPAVPDQTQASGYNAVSLIRGSSENRATQNKLAKPVVTVYQFNDVWDRIQAGFKLSETYDHPSVISQLANYTDNQRFFEVIAQRSSPFLYWIVEEIEDRGLPMELALVPVVESTFNPNAYSREHAVGLWQFIGPTAESFGLQRDWWYDARRDPRASTLAALDYFEELYGLFDENWLLALAAYNTGDGNVRRAIRRSGSALGEVDFWELSLAGETRLHVPKILALATIISSPEEFGITLEPIANEEPLAIVEIGGQIDIAQAASLAKIDYAELRSLNPGYLQWATHPDSPQELAVPIENAELLLVGIQNMDPDEMVTWDRYEIRPGDSLSTIARKLGSRVDVLQTVNQLQGSRINAGDSLLVPRSNDISMLRSIGSVRQVRNAVISVPEFYTVRGGDNLWSIARRYDLKSKEIAAFNRIDLDAFLQPGQVLNLQFTGSTTAAVSGSPLSESSKFYRVRPGDSMARIARRFSTDLEELLGWNAMSLNDLIFPGQEIRVIPPESGLN